MRFSEQRRLSGRLQRADKGCWNSNCWKIRLFQRGFGSSLFHMLFLDRSRWPLKAALVEEELARDYCVRESGMTLLARRSGLDLHGRGDAVEDIRTWMLNRKAAII
ncbi:hypothetical protein [Methanothrix sp.]|uniref:hypothetical protein n=1 Tax=Methanothrix sp. TaxID=90426 RepID=UPI00257B1888|nr:hypothetical protein [Methanothrix sp.]